MSQKKFESVVDASMKAVTRATDRKAQAKCASVIPGVGDDPPMAKQEPGEVRGEKGKKLKKGAKK